MQKKYIIIAVVVIALVIGGAFLVLNKSNTVQVGNSTFKIPEGFKLNGNETAKGANVVKVGTDNTLLKVAELKKNVSLSRAVKSYTKSKNGSSIKVTKFDAGNSNIKAKKVVCRTNNTSNNTTNSTEKVIVRYYAKKGNSTYYIESKSNNKSIDAIVRGIFLSLNKK